MVIEYAQYQQTNHPVFPRMEEEEASIFLAADVPLIIIDQVVKVGQYSNTKRRSSGHRGAGDSPDSDPNAGRDDQSGL